MKIKLKNIENNIFRFLKDDFNYIDFCPERGGLITDWTLNGEKILYFDHRRFLDKKLSIRGGIPILFPICGNTDQGLSISGQHYSLLPQHGFARDMNWKYKFNKEKESFYLSLKDNEFTQKYYPFSFEIKIDLKIKLNCLIYEVEIFNNSNIQMPFSFGLHPYFNISDFKNIKFQDYPLVCIDQKSNSLQLTEEYLFNMHKGIDLLMYSSGPLSFIDYSFGRKITLINPYPFDINVIWSDPPRKMICLEPWTSPRNSLINGVRRILIPSYSSKHLKASIIVNEIDGNIDK